MEDLNPHANLFSRGASPPPSSLAMFASGATGGAGGMYQQPVQQQTPQQTSQAIPPVNATTTNDHRELSPPHSLQDQPIQGMQGTQPVSVPNPLESLFQHLNPQLSTSHGQQSQQQQLHQAQQPALGDIMQSPQSNSAPATPMSNMTSATTTSAPDMGRQHALLSLLGTVTSPGNMNSSLPNPHPVASTSHPGQQQQIHNVQQQQQIQQIPTPPGSAHQFMSPPPGNSNSNHAVSENSGRQLLDQLMSSSGSGHMSAGATRQSFDSPTHSLRSLQSTHNTNLHVAPSPPTPYGVSPYTPLAQVPIQPYYQHQQQYEPQQQHQQQYEPQQQQQQYEQSQQQYEPQGAVWTPEKDYLPELYPSQLQSQPQQLQSQGPAQSQNQSQHQSSQAREPMPFPVQLPQYQPSPPSQQVQHSQQAPQQQQYYDEPQGQQQQPPSSERNQFEFISPFDAFSQGAGASPGAGLSVKKKSVPSMGQVSQDQAQAPTQGQGQGQPQGQGQSQDDNAWPMPPSTLPDPKRRSVDNLLDQLTRGQAPANAPSHDQYDAYLSGIGPGMGAGLPSQPTGDLLHGGGHDGVTQEPRVVAPAQGPPPPQSQMQTPTQSQMLKQQQRHDNASPRGSPPKMHTQAQGQVQPHLQVQQLRPQARQLDSADSFTSTGTGAGQGQGQTGRRNKESSPGPRGSVWKDSGNASGSSGTGKKNGKGRNTTGQVTQSTQPGQGQAQSITFDVSTPMEEIQAPKDCVKYTAIALVKVESSFIPGSTIGATHWVAYAMSKGRVRVISRSSGDRTLLQLPSIFPPAAVVSDMAVYGNRLAGVTSDGGFVVWELPDVITDDVPGKILLCIYPSPDIEPLQSVKWHPKQPDSLAVASEARIYLINVGDAENYFGGSPITQNELHHLGAEFAMPMPSPLVAFDFDVHHFALGTVSADSTLTLWSIHDKQPFWSNKIRSTSSGTGGGEDVPSSVAFIDGGVIIGRRNGTIYQMLPVMSRNVSATIRFTRSEPLSDQPAELFGRANYDARIQTLWIANNVKESMYALRLGFETVPASGGDDEYVRPYVEQAVEFGGVKASIHFVILTSDADPSGEEADAACVAAKVPIGELALVAFSVHSTGVDQVLIRKEWYDQAMLGAQAKFPIMLPAPPAPAQVANVERRQALPAQAPVQPQPIPANKPLEALAPLRARTPPSEEIEVEALRPDSKPSGKNAKPRNAGWKEKERGRDRTGEREREREREKERERVEREQRELEKELQRERDQLRDREEPKPQVVVKTEPVEAVIPPLAAPVPPPVPALTESAVGGMLAKEMRKLEENLQNRIGRLVGKELDKQQQHMEQVRASEQEHDVVRQEKLMKLISSELTRNTTRLVEMAVKSEVQNSILPSLENITKTELKNALTGSLAKNLSDTIKQTLPGDVERIFTRADITANLARTFSAHIGPVVERQVKDAMNQSIIPTLKAQAMANHQELLQTMHSELDVLKNNVVSIQSETVRNQEAAIRDLEQVVRKLSEQVKFLSMTAAASPALGPRASPSHSQPSHNPPAQQVQGPYSGGSAPQYSSQLRQAPITAQPAYVAPPPPQLQYNQSQPAPAPVQVPQNTAQWYQPQIIAPQASHPTLPPPMASQQQMQPQQQQQHQQQQQSHQQPQSLPARTEEWDDAYLAVLHQEDFQQLQNLLSRSDPDAVMPLNAHPPLSQAVILTLVHRLASSVGDIPPMDENFATTLWWLQRAALVLDPSDPLIANYVPRVLPQVQQSLTTSRQRLSIIPGAPPQLLDAVRSISDVQNTLNRKPLAA